MEDRFMYKVVRDAPEPPPVDHVMVWLKPSDVETVARALTSYYPEFTGDPDTTTGMFSKIAREIKS